MTTMPSIGRGFQCTLLMVLYDTGMRRSEVARLKLEHIDSQRMIIRAWSRARAGKDRDLPLSPALLETLRGYWPWLKPRTYLFPSRMQLGCGPPLRILNRWHEGETSLPPFPRSLRRCRVV
jgi:integrase